MLSYKGSTILRRELQAMIGPLSGAAFSLLSRECMVPKDQNIPYVSFVRRIFPGEPVYVCVRACVSVRLYIRIISTCVCFGSRLLQGFPFAVSSPDLSDRPEMLAAAIPVDMPLPC
jgi:hypothetical protein